MAKDVLGLVVQLCGSLVFNYYIDLILEVQSS